LIDPVRRSAGSSKPLSAEDMDSAQIWPQDSPLRNLPLMNLAWRDKKATQITK
jgi:hypothetical protein